MSTIFFFLAGIVILLGIRYRIKTFKSAAYYNALAITSFVYLAIAVGLLILRERTSIESSFGPLLFNYTPLAIFVSILCGTLVIHLNGHFHYLNTIDNKKIFTLGACVPMALYLIAIFSPYISIAIYLCILFFTLGCINSILSPIISAYTLAVLVGILMGVQNEVSWLSTISAFFDFINIESHIVRVLVTAGLALTGGIEIVIFYKIDKIT